MIHLMGDCCLLSGWEKFNLLNIYKFNFQIGQVDSVVLSVLVLSSHCEWLTDLVSG